MGGILAEHARMGPVPKKIVAQKILGKYLQILGGDFAPL
jgi:hypothetical protein